MLRITAKHPVRAKIAGLPDYYESIGHAVSAVESVLAEYSMDLDCAALLACKGSEGSLLVPIVAATPDLVDPAAYTGPDGYENGVNFSWYRLRSGRFEVIKYVS